MRLFIFMSGTPSGLEESGPFWEKFDDHYASKFVRHMRDEKSVCTGCGEACNNCRAGYKLDFSGKIAGVHVHPDTLLSFVDNPYDYLPRELPAHDITIAINVHNDLLLEIPALASAAGSQALIVPVEDPDWLDPWVKQELAARCADEGIEFAAPKPFCALDKGEGAAIDAFMDEFKIGKPQLELKIEDGKVKAARVLRSAPCGDTYFVAHNIVGLRVGRELTTKASKYWHSYPCIASMKMDPEFNDTILHRAGHIMYEVLDRAVKEAKDKSSRPLKSGKEQDRGSHDDPQDQ